MAFNYGTKFLTIGLFLFTFSFYVVGQSTISINGGWGPWQVDPEIDCCVYGPFGLYKRYCNNPSPEGNGQKCTTLNGTLDVIEAQWRTCSCSCWPPCDNVTSFCANDTGKPAYCQCNYGMQIQPGSDPNNVTSCIVELSTEAPPTTTEGFHYLDSGVKDTLKAVGYASCGFLIVCIILSLILNLLTGNFGKDRIIQMCEEITLLVVHVLIVFGAEASSSSGFCKASSILLHYLFMCTMAFYCFESLHTYSMVTYVVPRNGYFPWFVNILLGFGIPLVPLAFSLGFQMDLYGANGRHCWCDLGTFQAWSFLFPVGFAAFICMIISEAQGQGKYHPLPDMDQRQYVNARISQVSLLLVTILCLLSYVLGLVATDMQNVVLYALFFAANIILGIVLLFFHTASSAKVRAITSKFCICFNCCMKNVEESPEQRPTTAKVAPISSLDEKPKEIPYQSEPSPSPVGEMEKLE